MYQQKTNINDLNDTHRQSLSRTSLGNANHISATESNGPSLCLNCRGFLESQFPVQKPCTIQQARYLLTKLATFYGNKHSLCSQQSTTSPDPQPHQSNQHLPFHFYNNHFNFIPVYTQGFQVVSVVQLNFRKCQLPLSPESCALLSRIERNILKHT